MLLDHDGPAVIAGDRTLTYADLRAAPTASGDPVEVIGANTPEFVLGLFGAWNAGATAVPLSGRLREYELERDPREPKGSDPLTELRRSCTRAGARVIRRART